jgi:hypothetical protein
LLEGEAGSLDQERQEEELVEEELVEEELVEEVEIEEGTRDRKNKRKKIGTKNPQNFFLSHSRTRPLLFLSLSGARAIFKQKQEHEHSKNIKDRRNSLPTPYARATPRSRP